MFVAFIIDNIIQSLDSPPFIFEMISTLIFSTVNFIIVLIVSGVADHKLVINEKIWKVGMIITYLASATIEILVHENQLKAGFQDLHVILLDVMTLFAGSMVVYAFITTPFMIRGSRTNQTRGIWIIIGILLFLIGIIRIWNNMGNVVELLFNKNSEIPQILDSDDFVDYVSIVIGLLAIILALFYPDTMLLSQTQIMKVAKLFHSEKYKLLLDSGNIPMVIGKKEALKRYIKEVGDIIVKKSEE